MVYDDSGFFTHDRRRGGRGIDDDLLDGGGGVAGMLTNGVRDPYASKWIMDLQEEEVLIEEEEYQRRQPSRQQKREQWSSSSSSPITIQDLAKHNANALWKDLLTLQKKQEDPRYRQKVEEAKSAERRRKLDQFLSRTAPYEAEQAVKEKATDRPASSLASIGASTLSLLTSTTAGTSKSASSSVLSSSYSSAVETEITFHDSFERGCFGSGSTSAFSDASLSRNSSSSKLVDWFSTHVASSLDEEKIVFFKEEGCDNGSNDSEEEGLWFGEEEAQPSSPRPISPVARRCPPSPPEERKEHDETSYPSLSRWLQSGRPTPSTATIIAAGTTKRECEYPCEYPYLSPARTATTEGAVDEDGPPVKEQHRTKKSSSNGGRHGKSQKKSGRSKKRDHRSSSSKNKHGSSASKQKNDISYAFRGPWF